MAVKWVFFDVGDVLFDEDVPHLYLYHSVLLALRRNGIIARWDEYHAAIERCVRTAPLTAVQDAARPYVADPVEFDKIYKQGHDEYNQMRRPRPYGLLLDNITAVVEDLAADYKLGIIANQHPPILQALDDYGIGPLFSVKIIDEVVGVSKPDPAIFRMALNAAECIPAEAIMVGDRPDHDIAPARGVGMRTVRFRRGVLYSHYDPRIEEEVADIEVRTTARLAAAVRSVAAHGSAR